MADPTPQQSRIEQKNQGYDVHAITFRYGQIARARRLHVTKDQVRSMLISSEFAGDCEMLQFLRCDDE